MGRRRSARELALQVLYHLEFDRGDPEMAFEVLCANFAPEKAARPFARELVLGVHGQQAEVDGLIETASEHWRVARMLCMDRCILRLATFELLYREDIPPKASIDEAVELGKKYGTESSAGFINGILDRIYTSLAAEGRMRKPDAIADEAADALPDEET